MPTPRLKSVPDNPRLPHRAFVIVSVDMLTRNLTGRGSLIICVWLFFLTANTISCGQSTDIRDGLFLQPGKGGLPVVPFVRDDKYGFLDEAGRVSIAPQYEWAHDFVEGSALCKVDQRGVIIETNGSVIGKLPQEAETYFRASPQRIWYRVDRKWGLCDLKGQVVVQPQFDDVDAFASSLARVNKGATVQFPGFMEGGKSGFIDEQGNVVIDMKFDGFVWKFHGDYAVAGNQLIDRQGDVLFERPGMGIAFINGVIPIWKNKKTEYVDKDGSIVFSFAGHGEEFSEGLARVRQYGRYGFIDSSGNRVIACDFLDAEDFQHGLAAVSTAQNQWGYIDKSGTLVTPTHFNEARPANKNYLIVHYGGQQALVEDADPWWEGGRWLMTDRTGHPLAVLREDQPPFR